MSRDEWRDSRFDSAATSRTSKSIPTKPRHRRGRPIRVARAITFEEVQAQLFDSGRRSCPTASRPALGLDDVTDIAPSVAADPSVEARSRGHADDRQECPHDPPSRIEPDPFNDGARSHLVRDQRFVHLSVATEAEATGTTAMSTVRTSGPVRHARRGSLPGRTRSASSKTAPSTSSSATGSRTPSTPAGTRSTTRPGSAATTSV